jgi:hypothetical protein
VILPSQSSERGLYIFGRCVTRHAQDFIIIALGHLAFERVNVGTFTRRN